MSRNPGLPDLTKFLLFATQLYIVYLENLIYTVYVYITIYTFLFIYMRTIKPYTYGWLLILVTTQNNIDSEMLVSG